MIRFPWVFAWLRWRLLVNGLRGGRRRDAMERVSRVGALVGPALLFLVFLGSASVLGLLSLIGGWMLGVGAAEPAGILLAVRITLLVVLVLLVLVPVGGATHGAVARYNRLLLLPIPRQALHLVEVLSSLVDPWVAFVLPGIVLFAVGLMVAGRPGASFTALAAGIAMMALLASLGSLVSFLLNWFLRSRRWSEVFTLIFVLGISLIAFVPAFVSDSLEHRFREAKANRKTRDTVSVEEFDSRLPAWSRAIPSELYGRSIGMGVSGRPGIAWACVAVLLLEATVLYGISSVVHRKLIESAERGGARRRIGTGSRPGLLLPGLTPAASTVAIAQLRNALRSVRGRLVVLLPGPLLAVLSLLCRRIPDEFPGGALLGSHGYIVLGGGILFSLYALQAISVNQFASDRAGLTLQFLAPIPELDLVKGKAFGCGMILSVAVLLCLVCALIVAPQGSPFAWLSVLLAGAATYMLLCPVAALLSALFPKAADLSKTGSGGNPHALAMLIGTLLVFVLSVPPGLILAVVSYIFLRPGLALLLMAIWTLLAAAVAIPLLRLAARAVAPRRENLALVAQGR